MKKTVIDKSWIGGLVLFAGGLVVVGVSIGMMLAYGGHFTPAPYGGNGYDFVPALDGTFWTSVGLIVLGAVAAFAGWTIQLVAWVGSLINTNRLTDKTWFTILLIGGLVGIICAPVGFAVMLAYVLGGPDGVAAPAPPAQAPVSGPSRLVPTT